MIFAQLEHEAPYDALHEALDVYLRAHFARVESGLQGDSWFWILDGAEKVAVDTFTSMQYQVKSARPGPHVARVIEVLARAYPLRVADAPQLEGHEGGPD